MSENAKPIPRRINLLTGTETVQNNRIFIEKSEYKHLLKCEGKLYALEKCGVDNWEGYPEAMDIYRTFLQEFPID